MNDFSLIRCEQFLAAGELSLDENLKHLVSPIDGLLYSAAVDNIRLETVEGKLVFNCIRGGTK
jgi:hypothetical protein